MSFSDMRWVHVIVAVVLTVAVLGGGYLAYRRFGVTGPLESLLRADPDVKYVVARRQGGELVVEVGLGPVKDLAASYENLAEVTASHLGSTPYRLVIKDKRDDTLYEAYHSVHFFILEAAQKGNFSTMAREVEGVLTSAGIGSYRITVTESAIFVQIHSQDGDRYLYEVVPRLYPPKGPSGGGSA